MIADHQDRFGEQLIHTKHGAQIYSEGYDSGYSMGLAERSNRRWELVAAIVILAFVIGLIAGCLLP